ncbi:MAG: site-2 protease family protein [Firmicutes bacterium]|nr:site-2 protease family protein [Bacillota bacterium]
MMTDLTVLIYGVPGLLFALSFHEYAHAWMATRLGDPTPRAAGRLTLNPFAHVDWLGLIMLWVARFGWARPVPVDPRYFARPRSGMLWTALAGPAANAIAAVASAWLLVRADRLLGDAAGAADAVRIILYLSLVYNVSLAIFNLIPVPPLDGSRILGSLLPPRAAWRYQQIEPYGWLVLLLLVASGYVGNIIAPLINAITRALLGWFST